MTPDQIEQLTKEIVAGLDTGADMASVLAPEIIPFVLIGKALDKTIPGLAGDVARWLQGNAPTPEEKQALKAKLAVLGNPDLP